MTTSSPNKLSRRSFRVSKARTAIVTPLERRDVPAGGNNSESTSDAESSYLHPEYGLLDLDEPLRCEFRHGERVWVKLRESSEWVAGTISGNGVRSGVTRDGEGVLYPVRYNKTKRDYFAPQNGELKPDTPEVTQLLQAGGWL
ncbi:hypothetical protein C2E23DRAFT_551772 [Lenzites betulinus]|nr:hypothetical protein C2E23DRAFT_551772 [Lenzites betulinus]